ncbi:glycosyl hydrolase [Fusarium solani]|uniref:Glycosyl hydrolase n=1 Tax=Fusarium solani TaxID=169388 RepID=A0A9P9RDC4_FUSSL|nr:glycosyl hydrolase [Fusarium solani]KAH7275421.1 glycosyl hydrolase [Fusarium solani]
MGESNPIIPGFAPDPSVVRIDDTFYLVNSSFHIFPGLPIFASKDLVSWEHIGNAINRPSQLSLSAATTRLHKLDGPPSDVIVETGGLWAPTIRHHRERTYIICTNVCHLDPELKPGEEPPHPSELVETKNFIIFTDDIASDRWSDPVYVDFWGIDPDLFFEDDGRVFIAGCLWSKDLVEEPTIHGIEINIDTGEHLAPPRLMWTGSSKITPEGPHIYKRDGWYYLLIAEGGTFEGHQISAARSRDLWGPYEDCPNNPVLAPSPGSSGYKYIQHNGHGDLVQDTKGNWWLVCLAVRKDQLGRYGMGRETFLTPVQWPTGDSWPVIQQPIESFPAMGKQDNIPSRLNPTVDLVYLRDPDLSAYQISDDAQQVTIQASSTDLSEPSAAVSFVGRRKRSLHGEDRAVLTIGQAESSSSVIAGLACFKDEHRYARVFYDFSDHSIHFEVKNAGRAKAICNSTQVTSPKDMGNPTGAFDIHFRLMYSESNLDFTWMTEHPETGDTGWVLAGNIDILDLADRDFTGPCVGVFATNKKGDASCECTFTDISICIKQTFD